MVPGSIYTHHMPIKSSTKKERKKERHRSITTFTKARTFLPFKPKKKWKYIIRSCLIPKLKIQLKDQAFKRKPLTFFCLFVSLLNV